MNSDNLAAGLSQRASRRIYSVLCFLAHCDRELDETEAEILRYYRRGFGLTDAEAAQLEEQGKNSKDLRLGKSPQEQRLLIQSMIHIVAADGRLADIERTKMNRILARLGMSPDSVSDRIAQALTERRQSSAFFHEAYPEDHQAGIEQEEDAETERLELMRPNAPLPTSLGPVNFRALSQALAVRLSMQFPMGILQAQAGRTVSEDGRPCFGVVMKQGTQELTGLRLTQAPVPEAELLDVLRVNRARLARALGRYVSQGFNGAMLPCVCLSSPSPGVFEPGFAFFAYPQAQGVEGKRSTNLNIDRHLGVGASAMCGQLLEALSHDAPGGHHGRGAGNTVLAPLAPIVAHSIRRRSELGRLWLDFLAFDSQVFALKTRPRPEDQIWESLIAGGIGSLYFMPTVPIAEG